MDEETKGRMLASLEDYSRRVVESKAKEEARRVLIRVKDRFATLFSHDSDSMPWVWSGKDDIRGISKMARSASLKLLSVMAAIRLHDKDDYVENILSVALLDTRGGANTNKSVTSDDLLASSTWQEVPASKKLITPVQCKFLWRQFKAETEYTVTQAIAAKLPGLLSLSAKVLPTVTNVLRRLAVEGQKRATTEPQRTRSVASVNFQGGVDNNADSSYSGSCDNFVGKWD